MCEVGVSVVGEHRKLHFGDTWRKHPARLLGEGLDPAGELIYDRGRAGPDRLIWVAFDVCAGEVL